MWKRLPRYNRTREAVIGDPVLLQTTFDETQWQHIPSVSDAQRSGTSPTQKHQNDDAARTLPPLPFEHQQPNLQSSQWPNSDPPIPGTRALPTPATPEPDVVTTGKQSGPWTTYHSTHEDISPPSSPDDYDQNRSRRQQNSEGVSPVDELIGYFSEKNARHDGARSRIPVPRKNVPGASNVSVSTASRGQNQWGEALDVSARDSTATRWADFSEPSKPEPRGNTRDKNGNEVQKGLIAAGTKITGLRKRVTGKSGPKGTASTPEPDREEPDFTLGATSDQQSPPTIPDQPSRFQSYYDAAASDSEDIKPTVPLKTSRVSPPRSLSSSAPLHLQQAGRPSVPSSTTTTSHKAIDLGGPHAGNLENRFRAAMNDMSFQEQPLSSRFSITTYGTGTSHGSRPASPAISAFAPGNPQDSPTAMFYRPRPVPGSVTSNPKATIRKPTPSQMNSTVSIQQYPSEISKSLPQSPPEAESGDLITSLQAQLDNLHYRRRNANRIHRDLTQALPAGVGPRDVHSRREVARRVEACKTELAEIQMQEHELGIRLHKARCRKHESEGGESTALWVRRVTG
ncbi:MAG: hypothetical protein M1817_003025 [Caeruleum heppii]|nr:MAG: hypothetical protein M1817_003025 [Caeruleum heppii]